MKYSFCFFITLFLLSCSKEKKEFRNAISGTWELESSSTYDTTRIYPAGNNNLIVLERSGYFERRKGDTLLFKGNYFINVKKDCSEVEQNFFRTNETNNYQSHVISISENKLKINTSDCLIDGGRSLYRKIK